MKFEEFEKYLHEKKLRESTINGHLQDIRRFKKWCENGNIHYHQANYNELIKFIQQAKERGVSKSTINLHLNSIRKYYDYLIEKRKLIPMKSGEIPHGGNNPAKELRVKKDGKKVLQNLLTTEELEEIYHTYINKQQWTFRGEKSKSSHQRNIVILGLMIFQGVHTGELRRIEKTHINLTKGSIYIPGSGRSNGRILKLNVQQVIPMQNYLNKIEKQQEILFQCKMTSVTAWLIKSLMKMNSGIRDTKQLRNSVIVNWLKQHNIRQVQYMAGHRYISSTERYKQEDLEDLQKQLELFHPLK